MRSGTPDSLDLMVAVNAATTAMTAIEDPVARGAPNLIGGVVFDFLIDLMNLQRSLGGFDFFLNEQGLGGWLERLRNYITIYETS